MAVTRSGRGISQARAVFTITLAQSCTASRSSSLHRWFHALQNVEPCYCEACIPQRDEEIGVNLARMFISDSNAPVGRFDCVFLDQSRLAGDLSGVRSLLGSRVFNRDFEDVATDLRFESVWRTGGDELATLNHSQAVAEFVGLFRYWVVRNTVVPCWLISRKYSQRRSRARGSSPVVGSSRKTSGGSCTRAVATSRRFFIPPENSCACLSSTSARSTRANRSSIRPERSLRGTPYVSHAKRMFSRAVSSLSMLVPWAM